MPDPSPRPPLGRRVAARLVTGPAAFLVAGVLDWATLLGRWLAVRVRGRRSDWYLD
jgi:hypothetical protein